MTTQPTQQPPQRPAKPPVVPGTTPGTSLAKTVVKDREAKQSIREESPSRAVIQPPAPLQPVGLPAGSTLGISDLALTSEQIAVLRKELDPETEVEIRPDGVCYMPVGVIRMRLDKAFGPGHWAIRQERDPFYDDVTEECCFDGSLWVQGKFISRAIGGCRWKPKNYGMTRSDAIEGAKSDCLRRCCKDIGVGADLWSPSFVRQFVADYAVPYQGTDYKGQVKVMWRKKGQRLMGEVLASVGGLAGEFPLGFSPDTPVPDGPMAGTPLRDVDDKTLNAIMQGASTAEWRLSAKAEAIRRMTEARQSQERREPPKGEASDVVSKLTGS